ncbi:recombination regulator RecX [Lysobacteraceae bacterium NML120232]|nr:recombination regulator RecX [Xanthomonadaceae bacterium NML120232]PJK11050.1 recombination regulator RecX [Xanthomonadaceae bacterium NML08-0793]
MSLPPADDDIPRPRRRQRREQTPAQRALGLLVRREHSRKELLQKLKARGIADEEAHAAVAQMTDAGWQSNQRFAESLARNRAMQGYGPLHIRAELAAHGLESETISHAIESVEENWAQLAHNLVQRRFGEALAEDPARQRKAADLLLRRGFTREQMRQAIAGDCFDDEF